MQTYICIHIPIYVYMYMYIYVIYLCNIYTYMNILYAYQPYHHLYPGILRPHRITQAARIYIQRSWSWQTNQMTPCSSNVNIVRIVFITYGPSTEE